MLPQVKIAFDTIIGRTQSREHNVFCTCSSGEVLEYWNVPTLERSVLPQVQRLTDTSTAHLVSIKECLIMSYSLVIGQQNRQDSGSHLSRMGFAFGRAVPTLFFVAHFSPKAKNERQKRVSPTRSQAQKPNTRQIAS